MLTCALSAAHSAGSVSVAGLFPLDNSGRIVYNFNEGWRFWLGDAAGAETVSFDDSKWEVVCAPHIDRLEPSEASGCRNYQGVCWYRKHFVMPADMQGKLTELHFEAIMGKQWIYVNGRLVKEHLGGYLPITINLSAEGVKPGDKCLIAVTVIALIAYAKVDFKSGGSVFHWFLSLAKNGLIIGGIVTIKNGK